ncbi:MAG TPA: hypothetical protein VJS68_02580 [Thermoplasmata archaeon]|nr:hypothetical protein [Thermoplasmata archaeon]
MGVLALVVSAFPLAAADGTSGSGWAPRGWAPTSNWTNGVLDAGFATDRPAVTVSPSSTASYGMYAGVGAVIEVSPSNSPVASTDVLAANWVILNSTTGTVHTVTYGGWVPVVTSNGGNSSVGVARLLVNFTSSTQSDASSASTNAVKFTLFVGSWPWVNPQDNLALVMPVWPEDVSAEHLDLSSSGSDTMWCVENGSGTPVEFFNWSSTATAASTAGASSALMVTPMVSGGDESSVVEILFTGVSGGYSALSYDPTVGLVLSQKVLGLPLYDYALAGTAAAALAGTAGVALRQSRKRRWSLSEVAG